MANTSWKGTGFSDQSVPSLSNVAIRSGTGTKSGEPSRVTLSTNATMAFLAPVSFQEGNGSCVLGRALGARQDQRGGRHHPGEDWGSRFHGDNVPWSTAGGYVVTAAGSET